MARDAPPAARRILSLLRLRTPVHPLVLAHEARLFLLIDRNCAVPVVDEHTLRYDPASRDWQRQVAELAAARLLERHGEEPSSGAVMALAALACGDLLDRL